MCPGTRWVPAVLQAPQAFSGMLPSVDCLSLTPAAALFGSKSPAWGAVASQPGSAARLPPHSVLTPPGHDFWLPIYAAAMGLLSWLEGENYFISTHQSQHCHCFVLSCPLSFSAGGGPGVRR